jgi:hypothetical protein
MRQLPDNRKSRAMCRQVKGSVIRVGRELRAAARMNTDPVEGKVHAAERFLVQPRPSVGMSFASSPADVFGRKVRPAPEDKSMHPLQAAAQFQAFNWCLRTYPDASWEDTKWFAKTNGAEFLPVAQEGLGRLLLKLAVPRVRRGSLSNHRKRSRAKSICVSGRA